MIQFVFRFHLCWPTFFVVFPSLTCERLNLRVHVNMLFFYVSSGKVKALYDTQAPACPVCQAVLRPGELQEHMEQELSKVAQLQVRYQPDATRFYCTNNVRSSIIGLFVNHITHWHNLYFPKWGLPSSVNWVLCLQAASLFPTYFILQPPGDKSHSGRIMSYNGCSESHTHYLVVVEKIQRRNRAAHTHTPHYL